MSKPLKLFSHASGPNPWKVVIILEELNIPYETEYLEFPQMKEKPFTDVNPNGRAPGLTDPNTGVSLFESGAIIDYLVGEYDKDAKLHYTNSPEKYLQNSWAHFQMSGQGPYYGQKAWFSMFHSEKNITSAIDRYANEIKRVLGVIDAHLTKTGKPYLVGDKCTYADLMWIPWNNMVNGILLGDYDKEWKETYPKCYEWHQKLIARPAVKKMMEAKAAKASH